MANIGGEDIALGDIISVIYDVASPYCHRHALSLSLSDPSLLYSSIYSYQSAQLQRVLLPIRERERESDSLALDDTALI